MINTDLRQLFLTPTGFLALGFGTGLAPKAPGTFGTLVAVPFLWLFAWLPLWEAGVVVFLALLIGIPICERASRQLGQSDPGGDRLGRNCRPVAGFSWPPPDMADGDSRRGTVPVF